VARALLRPALSAKATKPQLWQLHGEKGKGAGAQAGKVEPNAQYRGGLWAEV
jgi:hypothetical protein